MPVYTPIRTPRRIAATIPPSAEPSILKPVGGSVLICQASPFDEGIAIVLDQEQEMSMPAGVTWTFTAQWLQGVEMTRRDDVSGGGSLFAGALALSRASEAIPAGWQAVSEFAAGGVTLRVLQRIPPVVVVPPVVVTPTLRAASTVGFHHVHSGHSLTDTYSNGGIEGFPGDLNNLFIAQFGNEPVWEYNLTHLKDTIPGSPMRIRWDDYPNSPATGGIADFDTLVITEGGPPARPTPTDKTAANETLDYLMRFVENAYANGRADGAETILWSIWPNVEGWLGFGGANEANWSQFGGFRGCLDEYGRVFRFFAEYATWKMRRNHPDLPTGWRVWTFPGHAWMARVHDDAVAGQVPGINSYRDFFRDDIHPNALGEYGMAVFMHTMLYQRDLRVAPAYTPNPAAVPTALDTYFKRIAWEIASAQESVGMGGTANSAPSFDPAVYGDPLDPTYVHGGGGTPPVTGPQPPVDSIIRWNAAGYAGPALTGPQPTVVGDVVRFTGNTALTFALNQPMTGYYACVRGRLSSPGTQFFLQMVGLTNFLSNYDDTAKLELNGFQSQFFASHKPAANYETWTDASSGVQNMSTPLTVEAWVMDGFVTVAVDGVEVQSRAILSPNVISPTSNILLMSCDSTDMTYDLNGMVVMNREPDEAERVNIRTWVAATPTGVVVPDPEPEPEPGVAGPTFTALANTAPIGFAGHSSLMEILDGGNFGTHWPGTHHAASPADGYHSRDHWEADGAAMNNPISAMVISEMDEGPNGRYAAPGTAQAATNLQHQYWFGRMAADQNASLVLLWHTTPRASYAESWEHNRSVINFYRQWLTDKLGRTVFVLPADLYITKLRETMADDDIWQDGVHLRPAVRPGLGYMLARMLSGVVPAIATGEGLLHAAAMEALAEYRWGGTGGTGNDQIFVAADPLPNPLPIPGDTPVDPDPEPGEITQLSDIQGLMWSSDTPIVMDGANVQSYALSAPGTVSGPLHAVINFTPATTQAKTGNNIFQVLDGNNATLMSFVYRPDITNALMENDFSGGNHAYMPVPTADVTGARQFVADMSITTARTPTGRLVSDDFDSTTDLTLPATNAVNLRFGTPDWGGEVLTGTVHRFAVFNRLLTEAERTFVRNWAGAPMEV